MAPIRFVIIGLCASSPALAQYINPFNGRLYRLTPERATWAEAAATAHEMGGVLATIRNPLEQEWLRSKLPLTTDTFVWLGGRDHGQQDWAWDSGDPFAFTNWRPGEPDGDPSVGESFTALFEVPPFAGLWADLYETDGLYFGLVESCYANCDGSSTSPILNVLDFGCFSNAFAAGSTYANCDSSSTPPILNVLDFSCFLNRFSVGCN
jgi:hypothetical protein